MALELVFCKYFSAHLAAVKTVLTSENGLESIADVVDQHQDYLKLINGRMEMQKGTEHLVADPRLSH